MLDFSQKGGAQHHYWRSMSFFSQKVVFSNTHMSLSILKLNCSKPIAKDGNQ